MLFAIRPTRLLCVCIDYSGHDCKVKICKIILILNKLPKRLRWLIVKVECSVSTRVRVSKHFLSFMVYDERCSDKVSHILLHYSLKTRYYIKTNSRCSGSHTLQSTKMSSCVLIFVNQQHTLVYSENIPEIGCKEL